MRFSFFVKLDAMKFLKGYSFGANRNPKNLEFIKYNFGVGINRRQVSWCKHYEVQKDKEDRPSEAVFPSDQINTQTQCRNQNSPCQSTWKIIINEFALHVV